MNEDARSLDDAARGDLRGLDAYLAESGESDDAPFPWRPLDRRYRTEGEPRKGGMSELWRAQDVVTGASVAVKRLRAHRIGNDRAQRRFHREALSMASLSHRHVLRLLDVGRDDAGDYLVFEWAARGSLSDKVRSDGALNEEEVFAIATKIGDALAFAHARGHVHRDVKPHNILRMEDGDPKLADFGLVLLEGESELLVPGARPGTPNYMAPEQATHGAEVDARADVYAFAKTLYYLLTGERPLAADLEKVPWAWRRPLAQALETSRDDRTRRIQDLVASIRRRRWLQRRAPVATLALVVAIFAFLLLSRVGFFTRIEQAQPARTTESVSAPSSATGPSDARVPVAPSETSPRSDTNRAAFDWAAAIALARDPLKTPYGGLALREQSGLLPLRQDPVSRMLEFLAVGSGEEPSYNPDGRQLVSGATGIVLVLVPFLSDPTFVGKYEVTQAQYSRLARAEPSRLSPRSASPGIRVDLAHPVENLSGGEARAALRSIGLRLPTEREWEAAWRAGENESARTSAPWNENLGDIADVLGRIERGAPPPPRLRDGFYGHAPVGSFNANAFGLFDLGGNVAEWCEGSSVDSGPIARGGSFADPSDPASFALRRPCDPETRSVTIGVRAARTLEK